MTLKLRTLFLAVSLCGARAAFAQVDTGSLTGTVRDPSGAVIANAGVKIERSGTGSAVSLLSNTSGLYSQPGLKAGVYSISVSAVGFKTVSKTGVEVRIQDRVAVDFELPIGTATNTITVESTAPVLDAETSSLGAVVEEKTIKNLPLNGRNYIQLATLAPGTSPSQQSNERNSFVANGARSIQNSYLLDGVDNKNKIVGFDNSSAQSIEPVLDSVQEFKVQTSTFSAEFGQSAGAVVNVTTKSGTNQLHGSAFEFLRNSFLDASPYFKRTNMTTIHSKPVWSDTGWLDHQGSNVLLFWMAEFSRGECRSSARGRANRCAKERRLHDANLRSIHNRAERANLRSHRFRGQSHSDLCCFDPVSTSYLRSIGAKTSTPGRMLLSNQRERVDNDQFVGRVDHRFSEKDSLFGRYSSGGNTNLLPATLPPPASQPSIVTPEAHSFAASETHVFTPTLLNEARIGYQETRETQNISGQRLFNQYGIIGAPDIATVLGLPTFAVSGLTTIGTTGPGTLLTPATGSGNLPIDKQGRTIQVNDNLSWVHGRHTLKFGFDFQQVTLYANSTLNARPVYNFSGVYTQDPQQRSTTGAAFADYLLGQTSAATVSTRSISESRQHIYQGYVQDDWKLSAKLTLNFGLRYELPLPFYETANHYSNLILEPGPLYGTILGTVQPGRLDIETRL